MFVILGCIVGLALHSWKAVIIGCILELLLDYEF